MERVTRGCPVARSCDTSLDEHDLHNGECDFAPLDDLCMRRFVRWLRREVTARASLRPSVFRRTEQEEVR